MSCERCKDCPTKGYLWVEGRDVESRVGVGIQETPFWCPSCHRVVFNLRAIRDIVLIWPIPLSKMYVEGGAIVRPSNTIDVKDEISGRSDCGIILSYGPGFYHEGRQKFISTGHQLYVGAKAIYDSKVPWRTYAFGYDGKKVLVVICGYRDIKSMVEDE